MSNINPKSPYERPGSETGYESVNKRSTLRDRSTGPSMLVILLAVAAILVIGFLVFGRWNAGNNIAGSGTGTTSPSATTDTTPAVPPSGSGTDTGSTQPGTGSTTTLPDTSTPTPSAPATPSTPTTPGGTTTTP